MKSCIEKVKIIKTFLVSLKLIAFFIITLILFFPIITPPCYATDSPALKKKLDNGLLVLQKPSDRNNIVCICIVLKISVYDEREQKVGARALLANLLLEKISSKTTKKGIRILELMGVMSNVETSPDYISLSFITTPSDYKKILELIAEELHECHFDDKFYNKQKDIFVEKLERGKSGFSSIYDIFLQNFYRYHPYKLSEDTNTKGIKSIKREDIEKFLSNNLSSDKIVISITGNIDFDEASLFINKNFSKLSPKTKSRVEVQWEPKTTQKEIFLSSLSQMAYLLYGFSAPSFGSPDYPTMKVLQTILGEGLNSRLWVELREKRGLAYQLGSFFPELEGPSHILIYVVTQPMNVINVRRIITKEIKNIQINGVRAEELTNAKAKIYGYYLLQRESTRGQAMDMAVAQVIGGKYALDVNIEKKIEEVNSEDIKKIITKYFQEPTLLVVRPPGHYYIDWFE